MTLGKKMKTVHYEINNEKNAKSIRVSLITDLHSCLYGEDQKELLNAVFQQQPDIVLFGGDIIDEVLPQKNAFIVLEVLSKKYPCFLVSGNHEYRKGNINAIKKTIANFGITILEGICKTITINNQSINICGIDDADVGEKAMLEQLSNVNETAESSLFTILLAHRPEYIDYYLKYSFDLILCGHAHGGQWRLPGLINGLYAPNQGCFPKYAGGQYKFEKSMFIISRGLAKEKTIVPRIFNRPELVIIDIISHKKTQRLQ